MYSKNGKQLHINNCLAYKLINKVINRSLGSYLRKNNLTNIKKISEKQVKLIMFLT